MDGYVLKVLEEIASQQGRTNELLEVLLTKSFPELKQKPKEAPK